MRTELSYAEFHIHSNMSKRILIFFIVGLVTVLITEVSIFFSVTQIAQSKQNRVTQPTAYDYWLNKKSIMTSSTKTDVSEGKIVSIESHGGSRMVNGVAYDYALKIDLIDKEGAIHSFIYDKRDLERKRISSDSGKLDFFSLKVGDMVMIKETINLLDTKDGLISIDIKKR